MMKTMAWFVGISVVALALTIYSSGTVCGEESSSQSELLIPGVVIVASEFFAPDSKKGDPATGTLLVGTRVNIRRTHKIQETEWVLVTSDEKPDQTGWIPESSVMQGYPSPIDLNRVNDLAFDVLRKEGAKHSNTVISPWGIWASLRILVEGSQGDTQKELVGLIGQPGQKSDRIRSATFLSSELLLKRATVDLTDKFDAFVLEQGIRKENSRFDDVARIELNRWINERSAGMLPNYFSGDNWNAEAEMILCNVATFRGQWQKEFPTPITDEDFRVNEKETVRVPMMIDTRPFRWYADDSLGVNAVLIPFKDDGLLAAIIVPQADFALSAVLDQLNSTHLASILTKSKSEEATVFLPRFSFDDSIDVLDDLPNIKIARTDDADFLAMTKNRTKISRVIQKSRIEVDEKGARASSATVTDAVPSSVTKGQKRLMADQPFLFVILHPNGLMLFSASVWNPIANP